MSVRKPKKFVRKQQGPDIEDAVSIQSVNYNKYSGAFKNIQSGPSLEPLKDASGTNTTDATTARSIAKGAIVAVFNNSTTVYAITFGLETGMAALAPGAIDANGRSGLPCEPQAWTYFTAGIEYGAAGNDNDLVRNWVRTNNAALLVYTVKDDSDANIQ